MRPGRSLEWRSSTTLLATPTDEGGDGSGGEEAKVVADAMQEERLAQAEAFEKKFEELEGQRLHAEAMSSGLRVGLGLR